MQMASVNKFQEKGGYQREHKKIVCSFALQPLARVASQQKKKKWTEPEARLGGTTNGTMAASDTDVRLLVAASQGFPVNYLCSLVPQRCVSFMAPSAIAVANINYKCNF